MGLSIYMFQKNTLLRPSAQPPALSSQCIISGFSKVRMSAAGTPCDVSLISNKKIKQIILLIKRSQRYFEVIYGFKYLHVSKTTPIRPSAQPPARPSQCIISGFAKVRMSASETPARPKNTPIRPPARPSVTNKKFRRFQNYGFKPLKLNTSKDRF